MKASTNRKSTVDEGSLDQYLRDISVFPLINREKEVELAKLIRQNDQEALDTLVRSNLRFVVSVADSPGSAQPSRHAASHRQASKQSTAGARAPADEPRDRRWHGHQRGRS